MRILFIITLFLCLLAGCGSGVLIDIHYISTETMLDRYGLVDGHAEWDKMGGCDIYLLYPDVYPTEERYLEVLGHEVRHCFEHNWHE